MRAASAQRLRAGDSYLVVCEPTKEFGCNQFIKSVVPGEDRQSLRREEQ
jgi:hypothetical protein